MRAGLHSLCQEAEGDERERPNRPPPPLYKQWFATYQSSNRSATVNYEAVGSGEGIRRFIARDVKDDERVDFGASDAAMYLIRYSSSVRPDFGVLTPGLCLVAQRLLEDEVYSN